MKFINKNKLVSVSIIFAATSNLIFTLETAMLVYDDLMESRQQPAQFAPSFETYIPQPQPALYSGGYANPRGGQWQ